MGTLAILFLLQIGTTSPPAKAAPLKCPQYQHVYHWPGNCGPAWCDPEGLSCDAICTPVPPDRCEDDMHEVTEREWQEIMKRLQTDDFIIKKLEENFVLDKMEMR